MSAKDKIRFHSERAMAEIDLALRAASAAAAQAHFSLSSLHLAEMRTLAGSDVPLPVRSH